MHVEIDRDRAAALGVTPQQIEDALYDAYGSRQVSTIFTPNNQYWVILELMPEFQRDVDALRQLYVRSPQRRPGAVSAVATLTSTRRAADRHARGADCRAVTISFNLKPGVSLGEAVDVVNAPRARRFRRRSPPASPGTAQAFQSSQQGLLFLLIVAVLVIYLVLGILYESFIHPLTILSGLPFAGLRRAAHAADLPH